MVLGCVVVETGDKARDAYMKSTVNKWNNLLARSPAGKG